MILSKEVGTRVDGDLWVLSDTCPYNLSDRHKLDSKGICVYCGQQQSWEEVDGSSKSYFIDEGEGYD